MKKCFVFALVFLLSSLNVFAQDSPQVAFRFLDNYITEKENESGSKAGAIVTISIGSALLVGSGVAWFFGDDISAAVSADGQPWDSTSKYITVGALAAGGLLSIGTGIVLLLIPAPDYRGEYAHIYEEEDHVLREALAAAALKGLSEKGRRDRMVSGWTNLSIPIITVAAQVAANLSEGRPWHENVFSISSTLMWQIVSGISDIFFNKSEEEILFEEYRAAQAAVGFAPIE